MRSVTLQVRNEKIKADDAVRQEAEGKLDLHRRSAARLLDEFARRAADRRDDRSQGGRTERKEMGEFKEVWDDGSKVRGHLQ